MANLEYIIDEVEKLQKKEKSLAKHLDPDKNYKMNQPSTEKIDSHPDSWKKKDLDYGYIIDKNSAAKLADFGSINEEGKFILDKDKDEIVVDDKDEILIDDNESTVDLNNISTIDDKEVVDDKIEIDGGDALTKIINTDLKKEKIPPKKKTAFAKFTENVGSAFENIATALPKKMEEVWADKDRKRMFLRGLEIINASSGITSLSQAKSPLGKISEGLLKAESKFTAEDLAWYKAKNPLRRYPSHDEKAIIKSFEKWQEKTDTNKDAYEAVFAKYNLAKNIALKKGELPTGILNKTFRNIKAFLAEVPGGEELYNSLAAKFEDENYTTMTLEDQTVFNDLFQAATFAQVVQEVKKLYPVSNKDIDTLLQTKGDIGSRPEALRRLIAAQMATREIVLTSEDLAYKFFEEKDMQFEKKSIKMSEKLISDKLRKENYVTDSTLEELFGSKDDVTNAGYISAYYYQKMTAEQLKTGIDPYTIFVTAQKEKEKIIEDKKKKWKKKKTDT